MDRAVTVGDVANALLIGGGCVLGLAVIFAILSYMASGWNH